MKKEILNDNTDITANSRQIELLKKNFPQCFDKDGNFIIHKMEEIVGDSGLELSKESYSLNWLGKSYARLLANENPRTLLKEDKEHNALEQNKGSQNLIVKGDNLEVLKHLSNAYAESIKMIYIDPPYNTGSDGFVYNDDRKFKPEELSRLSGIELDEAKRVLEFTQSNANSHSAWLTFMYPRLYIARNLLKEDGLIYISIDENEYAQLKMLCDEIFGEENFIGDIIRKTKSMTADAGTGFNLQHEYLLSYAKEKMLLKLHGEVKKFDNYKNPDNDENGDWVSGDPSAKSGSDSTYFEIENPYTKEKDLPPKGRYWAFSKESFEKYVKMGKIKFKKTYKNGERGFIFKRYKKELKSQYNPLNSLFFMNNEYMNQVGTKELRELFGREIFENPKPTIFLRKLIQFSTSSNDIILDFFAGSGTTAHAVMELNAIEKTRRKYLLVQLPEKIDENKSQTTYDYVKTELKKEPIIFEVTKSRIIKAAQNILEKFPKSKGDFGFKIYETLPVWDGYLDDISELKADTTLFDGSKLNDEELEVLLTTWKVHDGMELSHELSEIDLAGYKGYLGEETLYFVNTGFSTEALKKLIEKLDSDKTFEPSRIVLFGYNFASKYQKELTEALSSYANKKSIELDLIVRY